MQRFAGLTWQPVKPRRLHLHQNARGREVKKKKQTRLEKRIFKNEHLKITKEATIYLAGFSDLRYELDTLFMTHRQLKSFHKKLGKLLEEVG